MFSYFTELNRKRPDASQLDLVSFTTSAMVHAGDDHSLMESRESYSAIIATAKSIAGTTPWAVGPSAIGVRDNPYGDSAKFNDQNLRQAMNWNDPRQRGLFGAVWYLCYFSHFAQGGARAIALGAPVGPFGCIASDCEFPQPWYQQHGGLYPLYHVFHGLARLQGCPQLTLNLTNSDAIIGLAAQTPAGIELWLGNTTESEQSMSLDDALLSQTITYTKLDDGNFTQWVNDTEFTTQLHPFDEGQLTLAPYAVAKLVISAASNPRGS